MKTFDKKDVFTLVTAEEAIAYIGKRGYFGDSFKELESNINKDCGDNLGEVFPDRYTSIVFRPYACETSYGLFIPTDKVKEVEEPKKWRAFKDLDDLKTYANKSVGSILVYRQQNKDNTMRTSVITDYVFSADCIFIGNRPFSFETLFEEYELLNEHGIWQPFGVEE